MQLNDVIKSIGWYTGRAFVALPIQTDTTKNITNTDIGIGASLANIVRNVNYVKKMGGTFQLFDYANNNRTMYVQVRACNIAFKYKYT